TNWDAALAEFTASRKLFPRCGATRNAALALQMLGRYADEIEMYDTLLAEFASSIPMEELAQIRAARTSLLARVGELALEPDEPNSSLVVDGQQRAITPLAAPLRLDVGAHTVRLSRDGFETLERQITITPGGKRVIDGRLRALMGTGTLVVNEINA